MKYCVYADGSTVTQENGTVCPILSNSSDLVDEFEIANTDVTVTSNMFWANVAIAALFLLPKFFGKKGR